MLGEPNICLTHTHTHIYIYIYICFSQGDGKARTHDLVIQKAFDFHCVTCKTYESFCVMILHCGVSIQLQIFFIKGCELGVLS